MDRLIPLGCLILQRPLVDHIEVATGVDGIHIGLRISRTLIPLPESRWRSRYPMITSSSAWVNAVLKVAYTLEPSTFLFCTTTSVSGAVWTMGLIYNPYPEAELVLDSSVSLASINDPTSTLQRTIPSNVIDGIHRPQQCNTPGPQVSETSSLTA